MNKIILMSFILLTCFNLRADEVTCSFETKAVYIELDKEIPHETGNTRKIMCDEKINLNFSGALADLLDRELKGPDGNNSISQGVIIAKTEKHSEKAYRVKSYSWTSANGDATLIPASNGVLPVTKINCSRKNSMWLRKKENRDQCKKIEMCYGPLHGDFILHGLCEKVTNDANEFKNYKPQRR